jgi:transcriptional regulator
MASARASHIARCGGPLYDKPIDPCGLPDAAAFLIWKGVVMSKPQAMVQGTLSLLILKILDLEPGTGWAISQRLRQMSNEKLQASHGSLYPALHKLEREGWIRGEWQKLAGGRPVKVYALTQAGRRQLRVETVQWVKLSSAINGILESV